MFGAAVYVGAAFGAGARSRNRLFRSRLSSRSNSQDLSQRATMAFGHRKCRPSIGAVAIPECRGHILAPPFAVSCKATLVAQARSLCLIDSAAGFLVKFLSMLPHENSLKTSNSYKLSLNLAPKRSQAKVMFAAAERGAAGRARPDDTCSVRLSGRSARSACQYRSISARLTIARCSRRGAGSGSISAAINRSRQA